MNRVFLAAIVILAAALPGHAVDNVVVDGVTYEWSAPELGYVAAGWDGETPIQSLHICGEVNGLNVVGIAARAFEDNADVVFLTIDEGITRIGQNAFGRCTNLQTAILPEGLVTIEEEAFVYCSALTMMVIPSTVQDIQSHAFAGCTGVADVYFLMDTEDQLRNFDWWDGVNPLPGQDEHGGMEFNTREHTTVHVPAGTYNMYDQSGKLEAWLFQEDTGAYPLWWIVNFGVVGRSYTVGDDLTAEYADKDGNLYAKDDNHWLTPDNVYPGEVDYMKTTRLMSARGDSYDQSNWVMLTHVGDAAALKGHLIAGSTITGVLADKKNPVIAVSGDAALEAGASVAYAPNTYIPAAFMARTQLGADGQTYAFVRPKPQELIHLEWAVYNGDDGCFYVPESVAESGINRLGLKGGFKVRYGLCEQPEEPQPAEGVTYAFDAVNRFMDIDADSRVSRRLQGEVAPYVDGGRSDTYVVYPLNLPEEPIITSVAEIKAAQPADPCWHTIDGRFLGTAAPKAPGLYIHGNRKVVVVP